MALRFFHLRRLLAVLLLPLLFSGCASVPAGSGAVITDAPSVPLSSPIATAAAKREVALAQPSGETPVSANGAEADVGNASLGYVRVRCASQKKLKVQIRFGETLYTYDLAGGSQWTVYPLQCGDGQYTVSVFENISDTRYSTLLTAQAVAQGMNAYAPYLLPNQYVDYDADSASVLQGFALTENAQNDLAVVKSVFEYVTQHISYDYDKAATVTSGYIPDPDAVLQEGKGICFDYASVMAVMLRSQNIPAKLIMGYVEPLDIYHAWNQVYITDVGWIDLHIYFDGKNWQLVDATFAANGSYDPNNTYIPVGEY